MPSGGSSWPFGKWWSCSIAKKIQRCIEAAFVSRSTLSIFRRFPLLRKSEITALNEPLYSPCSLYVLLCGLSCSQQSEVQLLQVNAPTEVLQTDLRSWCLWMMGYHSLCLRLCHCRGMLWKHICSAGCQRTVAQVVTTMGLGDYWKVGEKRALSFIVFLTCGKHWPILVPREPISSTEEVSCHPGGRTWLNPAWCKKGKRKSQHNRKWKVRSPRSFWSRNCIGVLSSESTFELEFCGTFTKALKCNTLLLCHSFTKMMCQSATEPYLFLSSIVCKKHILLYLSIPGAGTMTIQQEDPISFSTRKNIGYYTWPSSYLTTVNNLKFILQKKKYMYCHLEICPLLERKEGTNS